MKLTDKQPGSEKRVIEGATHLIWKFRSELDQKLLGAQPEIDTQLLQWKKRIDDPIGYESVAYDEIGRLTGQICGFCLVWYCKLKASGTTGIQQWLALHKVSATVLPSGSVYVSDDLDHHSVGFRNPHRLE